MSESAKAIVLASLAEAQKKLISILEFSQAVNIPTRTLYLWKKTPRSSGKRGRKSAPQNRLSASERREVVDLLLKPEWSDLSPREIYYKLLDEEQKVIASPATFYRIAKQNDLSTRRGTKIPTKKLNRETPHLLAVKPNEIWSWDVSQIRSHIRTTRFYLYVIIDIWSRFVVGWILENHEKTDHAIAMWKSALEDQAISGKGLVNHKDNGSIMTSDDMIGFINDVQMIDSYSRAGVSDDNPFSESLFSSIKRFREFPGSFSDLKAGRDYFTSFFTAYNYDYRHSGIQYITPAERHYGEEIKILNIRNQTTASFQEENPHRYSAKRKIFNPINEVKIN